MQKDDLVYVGHMLDMARKRGHWDSFGQPPSPSACGGGAHRGMKKV